MLVVLDTDHLSVMQERNQPDWDRLQRRLAQHPADETAFSIVSFQEQAQGWLSWINRSKKGPHVIKGYMKLQELIIKFRQVVLLPFDSTSQQRFENLTKLRLRIGTLDLRIAAIALANQATLLSRNSRDFSKVPGLRVDDWTR